MPQRLLLPPPNALLWAPKLLRRLAAALGLPALLAGLLVGGMAASTPTYAQAPAAEPPADTNAPVVEDRSQPVTYLDGLRPTGWFLRPYSRYMYFDGNSSGLMGIDAGIYVNNRFTLSLGYQRALGLADYDLQASEQDTVVQAALSWWAIPLTAEVFVYQNRWMHLAVPISLMVGRAGFTLPDSTPDGRPAEVWAQELFANDIDAYFVAIELGPQIDFKLAPWTRLSLSAGLRIVNGWLRYDYVNPSLNGFYVGLNWRLGHLTQWLDPAEERRRNASRPPSGL